MKEKAFISIIVYVHNEVGRVAKFLQALDGFTDSRFENYEMIVVNDSSTDGTLKEIKQTFEKLARDMTLIDLPWRHGSEKGILAGLDLAIGDFAIEIEMDKFDCDVNLIYDIFSEANRGYDIVSALRSKGRSIGDMVFFALFNRISYLPFEVNNETFRIVSRRAINSVTGMNERIIYREILYKYSGLPNKTIMYDPVKGGFKRGEMTFREKVRLALDVIVSYSNVGTNIAVLFASVFAFISVMLCVYALIVYFTFKGVVPGWTTTVLFMSVCFAGIFVVLGLQSRYISSLVYDIKKRPAYTIRAIERPSRQRKP